MRHKPEYKIVLSHVTYYQHGLGRAALKYVILPHWQHRAARPLRRGLEPASLSTRVIALLYLLSVLLHGSIFLHMSMTTDSGRPWQSRRPLHIPCYPRLASPENRRRNVMCAFIVPIHRKAPGTLCGLTGCSRQRQNVPLFGVSCA